MTTHKVDLHGRKVLFVAYFYPPSDSKGVPGCMRTIKFIRNLSNGECHVLTSGLSPAGGNDALSHLKLPINGEHIHRIRAWDTFKLLLAIRQKLRTLLRGQRSQASANGSGDHQPDQAVFKNTDTPANPRPARLQRLKDFIYNLCYFPDQAGPWIIPAFISGYRLVRKHNLNVIFATGSPWSGLVTGYLISKSTGKPLIADFRDPWVNNPFHHTKGRLLDRWSTGLERRVVEHAAAVSLNTPPLMEEFLLRYPEQPPEKFFVMPNGFDPADFEDIQPEARSDSTETFLLCHAGFLYGVRDPRVLLEAIRQANVRLAGTGQQVVFRQIGDVQLSYDVREQFSDLLENQSFILEQPRPYLRCLSALASADSVVNIQPATQSQIPSKLYDYLGINRPILNITARNGALGKLVNEKQIGTLVEFNETDALTDILVGEAQSKTSQHFTGYTSRTDFDVRTITATLASHIIRLSD